MEETELFRALGSADRQALLHKLVTTDGTVTTDDLSREVAARRHHIPREEVRKNEIDRAHLRLVHTHLPLLRELDIVECDDNTVSLVDECREQLLEAADMIDVWSSDDLMHYPDHSRPDSGLFHQSD